MSLICYFYENNYVPFKFYDSQGNLIISFSENPKATLFDRIDGTAILSDIDLEFNGIKKEFYLTFFPLPSEKFKEGTYYFRASGIDVFGNKLTSTVFIDLLDQKYDFSILTIDELKSYVDDTEPDINVLRRLVRVACDYVEQKTGKSIFPKKIVELIKPKVVNDKKISLILSHFPILKIYSIKPTYKLFTDIVYIRDNYFIEEIDLNKIEIDFVNGIIDLSYYDISYLTYNYLVEYSYGWQTIPALIQNAIGLLVGYLYNEMRYASYDSIRTIGITTRIDKEVLNRIDKLLKPYQDVI